MAVVTVTIRTVDDQGVPVPIDDVLVRVYNDSDVFITEGLTGVAVPTSGEIEFLLNGEPVAVTYRLRLSKVRDKSGKNCPGDAVLVDIKAPVCDRLLHG